MDEAIDPVASANEYREHILSLVGDDDPEMVQLSTWASLRELVAEAGAHLRWRPEPGEWSVVELLGHFLDAELVSSVRYRWILAHDEPELPGYDQDLWVRSLGYQEVDPDDIFSVFGPLRLMNLALWRNSSTTDRARIGKHLERGPESYETTFRMIAGHDRFHLDQMRKTLAAVRAG